MRTIRIHEFGGANRLLREEVPAPEPNAGEIRVGPAQALFDWKIAGHLQARIDGAFPLEFAADAHRALQPRGPTGKLIVIP